MEVLVVGADLEVHEHDSWVLHGVLDCPKECMLNSLATIYQTVIVSEGNVYIMGRITTWPFLTTGHAEDGRLGWVDDGSPKQFILSTFLSTATTRPLGVATATDVDKVPVDRFLALDHGVHCGLLRQRIGGRFHEGRYEAHLNAVLLHESILVVFPEMATSDDHLQ